MNKHTPTPWKVVQNPMRDDGAFVCEDVPAEYYEGVKHLDGSAIEKPVTRPIHSGQMSPANAAHIVKCVNENEQLHERIAWLERIKEYGKRGDYLKMEIEILGYEGNCSQAAADPLGAKAESK